MGLCSSLPGGLVQGQLHENNASEDAVTKEEIKKIVENHKSPKGVFAEGADGQLFFLSAEDAKRMAIPASAPYFAFVSSGFNKSSAPQGARERFTQESCDRIATWLTSNVPRDDVWMGVAREFLAKC
jgi:hypothetical protein